MSFTARLELHGKTATGIEVPADVVEALGSHKRPPVRVTLNGYSYRSTIAPRGGKYMLPVSAEHREAAGVEAGDEVEVSLALDTAPREVEVPSDLAAAMAEDPAARERFDALSYSKQRGHVLSVEGAKAADTRRRRIEKVLGALREG